MASSSFKETNLGPKLSLDAKPLLYDNAEDNAGGDLVLVYNQNGETNFDEDALGKLLDTGTLNSLAVVHLTSPTASMIEEYEQEERTKAAEIAAATSAATDDSDAVATDNDSAQQDDNETAESHSSDAATDSDEDTDEMPPHQTADTVVKPGRRKLKRHCLRATKQKEKAAQEHKSKGMRSKVVGMVVSKFYAPEQAKQIAKKVLQLAKITPLKRTKEQELQLISIRNDHCYTPFTSLEQMQAKLAADKEAAEKAEQEKRNAVRKISTSDRQYLLARRKSLYKDASDPLSAAHTQKLKIAARCKQAAAAFALEQRKKVADVESDFVSANESDSTNERESDADYAIQSRLQDKRKLKMQRSFGILPVNATATAASPSPHSSNSSTTGTAKIIVSSTAKTSVAAATPVTLTTAKTVTKAVAATATTIKQLPGPAAIAVRRTPIVQQSTNLQTNSNTDHLKQIVINKQIISSPKGGGFTNISALLEKSPTTSSSNVSYAEKRRKLNMNSPSTSKGFTPLGMDAAVRNQLPAQISVQTHQSSSELAAAEQLDLINSFVEDELHNSKMLQKKTGDDNKSMTDIVRMLQSSGDALENVQQPRAAVNAAQSTQAAIADDPSSINLNEAALLQNTETTLPKDFIDEVVQILERNKSFSEVVDKELLGQSANVQVAVEALTSMAEEAIVAPAMEQQMYNANSGSSANRSDVTQAYGESTAATVQDVTAEDVLKESVQVQRGNGRVITLPAIEAPNTRAKRRAAVLPKTQQPVDMLNKSLNTALEVEKKLTAATVAASVSAPAVVEADVSNVKPNKNSTQRRRTAAVVSAGATKSKTKAKADKTDDELGDEDEDPEKLWCICRKPHNNRFMICCDVCEDWFHGRCVNISRAKGKEMEENGIDYVCPNCNKKKAEKSQLKITDMLSNINTKSTNFPATTQKSTDNKNDNMAKDVLTSPATKPNIAKRRKSTTGNLKAKSVIKAKAATPTTAGSSGIAAKTTTQKQQQLTADAVQAASARTLPAAKTPINLLPKDNKKSTATAAAADDASKVQETAAIAMCIVCKVKTAHNLGIYCSSDCINRHCTAAVQQLEAFARKDAPTIHSDKKKRNFEDLLAEVDRKPRIERITVHNRQSGRLLMGNNAPTVHNLRKWLYDNPFYEIVLPGSAQFKEIDASARNVQKSRGIVQLHNLTVQTRVQPNSSVATATATTSPVKLGSPRMLISEPSATLPNSGAGVCTVPTKAAQKQQLPIAVVKTDKSKETTLGTAAVAAAAATEATTKVKTKKRRASDAEERDASSRNSKSQNDDAKTNVNVMRTNVRRTFQDQLMQRIKEEKVSTLTADEINDFVNELEQEMFDQLFQDAGQKYKSKYRSLMFNITDRKNKTLFDKICGRMVEPKQLLHMSADELASQELAKWRQNESKHQLEMIKQFEFDSLTNQNKYVLKTHKGEEVIEDKSAYAGSNMDLTVLSPSSASAAAAVLAPITASDTQQLLEKKTEKAAERTLHDKFADVDKEKKEHDKVKEKDRDRDKPRGKEHEKQKSKVKSKDKSAKHQSHKSADKERDKQQHRKSEKRSHSNDTRRSRSKSKRRSRSKTPSVVEAKRSVPESNLRERRKSRHERDKATPVFNLVDTIIGSSKSIEEAANLDSSTKKANINSSSNANVANSKQSTASSQLHADSSNDSEQEPSSTTTIVDKVAPVDPYAAYIAKNPSTKCYLPTSVWSGPINMIDVASFQLILQPIMRNALTLGQYLPIELNVVGRISPSTVWEYLDKIKQNGNKEIILLRMLPASESATDAYTELYDYLHNRRRLGVIKTSCMQTKDFYIYPLAANETLPKVLKSVEDIEFFESHNRPNILIGIVVFVNLKRAPTTPNIGTPIKRKNMPAAERHSHHSTHSYKEEDFDVDAIIKAPIAAKSKSSASSISTATEGNQTSSQTTLDDANAPYSPGGGSSDDDVVAISLPTTAAKPRIDFNRQLDELNQLTANQGSDLETNSLSRPVHTRSGQVKPAPLNTVTLADIQIPPNLEQILKTINTPSSGTSITKQLLQEMRNKNADVEEYDPVNPTASYRATVATLSRAATAAKSAIPAQLMMPANSTATATATSSSSSTAAPAIAASSSTTEGASLLSQLSEAELLRMVPDEIRAQPPQKSHNTP